MSNLWLLCLKDITKAENKRGCPMNGAASLCVLLVGYYLINVKLPALVNMAPELVTASYSHTYTPNGCGAPL